MVPASPARDGLASRSAAAPPNRWRMRRSGSIREVSCTVELFGVPRLIAGQRRLLLDLADGTLADAARALGAACPALLGKVLDPTTGWPLDGYTFAIETRFTRDPSAALEPGAALLLVSSQAGG